MSPKRKGQTPQNAKIQSEKAILESLHQGKKTNTQLKQETGLSAPTLAARLSDMENTKRIAWEPVKDRRSKIYRLTKEGMEDLQRKWLSEDISMTPILVNRLNLDVKIQTPKWASWLARLYGLGQVDSGVTNVPSHLFGHVELMSRKSPVVLNFWNDVLEEFKETMTKRYPDQTRQQMQNKCHWMTEEFFSFLEVNFNMSIFSSIKMSPLENSKLTQTIFGTKTKLDYYHNMYLDLYEYFLKFLYDSIKREYDNSVVKFLDQLSAQGDASKKKIIMVLDLDLSFLADNILDTEMSFFAPKTRKLLLALAKDLDIRLKDCKTEQEKEETLTKSLPELKRKYGELKGIFENLEKSQ